MTITVISPQKEKGGRLTPEDFAEKFLRGKSQKQKLMVEGEVLLQWTHRIPTVVRILSVLVPALLLLGYFAFKYSRRVKLDPFDAIFSAFLLIFGARMAASSMQYSLTTVGVYRLLGANWLRVGSWKDFKSVSRKEGGLVLEKKSGLRKKVGLGCLETEKVLAAVAICNEQINKYRWS
jgi:hypothetical protein